MRNLTFISAEKTGCAGLLVLVLFASAFDLFAHARPDEKPGGRTVSFPDGESAGGLFLLDQLGADPKVLCPAKGKVKVPPGSLLRLTPSRPDLSFVMGLAPDAVQALDLTLEEFPATELAKLSRLTGLLELDLKGQALNPLVLSAICRLPRLLRLDLSGTTGLGPQSLVELSKLKSLERLYLSGTGLKSTKGLILPNLKRLNLDKNKLLSDNGLELSGLKGLTNLRVNNTGITDLGISRISNLSNLEELSLSATAVTGTGLKEVSKLKKLHTLTLAGTGLTDDDLQCLPNFPDLAYLNLSRTGISDRIVPLLLKCRRLKELNVAKTTISGTGLSRLRSGLPGCKIES